MSARALVLALLLGGCSLYAPPAVPECTVKCGAGDRCPLGSTCADGFCRPPNSTKNCLCTPGEQRECGGNGGRGECVAGLQKCRDEGVWGSCLGELRPSPELCDNRDNDCDGMTDEDVPGELCPNQQGACVGSRSTCVAGQMTACTEASYGPDFQVAETRCDGKDNDCDGLIDEGATVVIARGVGRAGWQLLRTGATYTVVRTGSDAGIDLVVAQRLDDALRPVSAVVLGRGGGAGLRAASGAEGVAAVWREGTTVLGAVLRPGGPVSLDEVVDAEADGRPLAVALRGSSVVALFPARGQQLARVLVWNASTGALTQRRDLNLELDNVPKAARFVDNATLSDQGSFASYTGDVVLEDGGFDPECFLHDLRVDGGVRYLCAGGVTMEAGPRLSRVTSISFNLFFPIPLPGFEPFSKVLYQDDVFQPSGGLVDIVKSADYQQIGASHAYLASDGLPVVAYEDVKLGTITLGRVERLGSNLTARTRPVGTDGGAARPFVAPGPSAGLVAVSWWSGSSASAKLVCSP